MPEGKRPIAIFQAALLVLDMQSYFLEPGSHAFVPSAQAILPGILSLIEGFSNQKLPVIFSQHVNTPENAGSMGTWWADLIQVGDPSSAIIPQLKEKVKLLIQKNQYDAFFQTTLNSLLHHNRVSQVVICGVMTHLCCETTARSAFMHGFEVFFPVDGSATYNLAFHQAALLNLAHGFATITTVAEILKLLNEPHEQAITD